MARHRIVNANTNYTKGNELSALPTIGFDTSVINRLEDRGEQYEPLMKALSCGFDVRLLGMNTDEIVFTPNEKAVRREALLARCQRLLASGQCIWPPPPDS
jgi:hypothetical protein